MVIEICLVVIAISLIALVVMLVRIALETQAAIQSLQIDLRRTSVETLHLLGNINEFVKADLRALSQEASSLVGRLNQLTGDISEKAHSLDFLFSPIRYFSSRSESDHAEPAAPVAKWVGSGIILIKTAKELIKRYGKRT